MDTDKTTTVAGQVAVGCAAVIGLGVLAPYTVAYYALWGIGTVAGSIWAIYTNKPNPMENVKPPEKK